MKIEVPENKHTLSLLVHNEATTDARRDLLRCVNQVGPGGIPIILIRSQEVTVLVKAGEAHAIWVSWEYLVPPPEHIAFHNVLDAVRSRKVEDLLLLDESVSGGYSHGFDSFRIRT